MNVTILSTLTVYNNVLLYPCFFRAGVCRPFVETTNGN